jgi:hypothetical protein
MPGKTGAHACGRCGAQLEPGERCNSILCRNPQVAPNPADRYVPFAGVSLRHDRVEPFSPLHVGEVVDAEFSVTPDPQDIAGFRSSALLQIDPPGRVFLRNGLTVGHEHSDYLGDVPNALKVLHALRSHEGELKAALRMQLAAEVERAQKALDEARLNLANAEKLK